MLFRHAEKFTSCSCILFCVVTHTLYFQSTQDYVNQGITFIFSLVRRVGFIAGLSTVAVTWYHGGCRFSYW